MRDRRARLTLGSVRWLSADRVPPHHRNQVIGFSEAAALRSHGPGNVGFVNVDLHLGNRPRGEAAFLRGNMMGRGANVMVWACCAVVAMAVTGVELAAATLVGLAVQRTVGA
jgi:hypothetical protein